MGNEHTKKQIKDWLDAAYKRMTNPDPLEEDRMRIEADRRIKKKNLKRRLGI